MKLRRAAYLVGVPALLLVACATTIHYGRMDLSKRLTFSHARHLDEADCVDCHANIDKSSGPTLGKFIPHGEHGGCESCHEDEVDDKAQCKMCHIGGSRKIALTRVDRGLRFSHKNHLERKSPGGKDKMTCLTCHPAAKTATAPGMKLVQNMANCAGACHQKDLAGGYCNKCHRDLQRKRLKPITMISHQPNFLKRHGTLAKDTSRCVACHDQTYCADCHAKTAAMTLSLRFPEKTDARFIHRNDFLGRHAAMARAEPATCMQCHGARHCSSCHALRGISTVVRGSQIGGRGGSTPHGPDFMRPGTPGFHGRLARRNITACAGCHDQGTASNCVNCHAVSGIGGNPHPPGFRWQNKRETCRNNSMCLTCHQGGAGC